jgi:DNA-binding transcriptional regulator YiaG
MMLCLQPSRQLGDVFDVARILVRSGFPVRTAKRVVDDLSAHRRAFAWTPAELDRNALQREAGLHGVEISYPTLRRVDVKALRTRLGMSQEAFAGFYGLDLDTVQNWEQGRTRPDKPAMVLLHLIDKDPDAILALLASS